MYVLNFPISTSLELTPIPSVAKIPASFIVWHTDLWFSCVKSAFPHSRAEQMSGNTSARVFLPRIPSFWKKSLQTRSYMKPKLMAHSFLYLTKLLARSSELHKHHYYFQKKGEKHLGIWDKL